MAQRFQGVFTHPVTPFDAQSAFDQDSLRRVVDWCVGPGHTASSPRSTPAAPALASTPLPQ
jgi:dihydrodipicolinate synthase/N-acetylneuraminate lyase